MGQVFHKTRATIKQNAMIVRTALRSSMAFFLHGNPEYTNEVKEALEKVMKVLKSEEYDSEDLIHEEIGKVFDDMLKDKPIYVKAAFSDLVDTMFSLVEAKITIDEDRLLSQEEREAWILILDGLFEIVEMVEKEEKKQ